MPPPPRRRQPARVYRRRRLALVGASLIVLLAVVVAALNSGGRHASDARPRPSTGRQHSHMPTPAQLSTTPLSARPTAARTTTATTRPTPHTTAPVRYAWPAVGQAALAISGASLPRAFHGGDRPVPIASLAKMMTVYIVLAHHPSSTGGLSIVVDAALVRDTARRRALGQSIVSVRAGDRLSQNQALEAILLPSANNIAVALAVRSAGSVAAFVREMNETAARLGMSHTHYTDPSGYSVDTVSTARDQLTLLRRLARSTTFMRIAGLRQATIPFAGRILNTDTLLGRDGFVAGKTGSDQAAGGCFAFARRTKLGTRRVLLLGVVTGQHDGPLIAAGLNAARRLADSVGPPAR